MPETGTFNQYSGWTCIDLTPKGNIEAKNAGQLLKKERYIFDVAYSSVLKRAIHTLWNVLAKWVLQKT